MKPQSIDRRRLLAATAGICASPQLVCAQQTPGWVIEPGDAPEPMREMRGAWIATVDNIDWPSRPGLPPAQAQQEMITLLDRLSAAGINAVFFQVRPAADALYPSELEPWSDYLTGEMGKPPQEEWDPLEFTVRAAHARGMELHAWFNPFRAHHPSSKSPISAGHLSRRRPELVHRYGRHLWMDPGLQGVHDHSLAVITDVVRRYDVDGVHLDDYFYPYKEQQNGRTIEFPDTASYAAYRKAGGRLKLEDWRRDNVNRFVRRLNDEVHRVRSDVRFGISPFGIWRPGHPKQIRGFDAYAELYADALRWWKAGWVDYLAPQLYWKINARSQSYPVLLHWWADQNVKGRHLWAGNYTSRIEIGGGGWSPREILEQIRLTRKEAGASGNIQFSAKAILQNRGRIADSLASELYAQPALPPASPWLGGAAPAAPMLSVSGRPGQEGIILAPGPGPARVSTWIVQRRSGRGWRTELLPGTAERAPIFLLPQTEPPGEINIAGAGRTGLRSPWVRVRPA